MIFPMIFHHLRSLTDEQLMDRVSTTGDDRAFAELYRRYGHRLVGSFYRQMRHNENLAADFTQDTFMRV